MLRLTDSARHVTGCHLTLETRVQMHFMTWKVLSISPRLEALLVLVLLAALGVTPQVEVESNT